VYAAEFADAHEHACDSLEVEARWRATDGVDEPVFYKGEVCGTVRRYSDTQLIFLLKGAMPEKYKDRVEDRIKREGILGGLSDEELEAIARGGSRGAIAPPQGLLSRVKQSVGEILRMAELGVAKAEVKRRINLMVVNDFSTSELPVVLEIIEEKWPKASRRAGAAHGILS
jgi:hypothetical protein